MRPSCPLSELSPDQRRHELASILAAGVMRVRRLRLLAGKPAQPAPKPPAESSAGRLELSGETVLSVLTG